MITTLTNMNTHPVAVKITRPDVAGTQVIDYVTLQPKGKIDLADGHGVHPNWVAESTGIHIATKENA